MKDRPIIIVEEKDVQTFEYLLPYQKENVLLVLNKIKMVFSSFMLQNVMRNEIYQFLIL